MFDPFFKELSRRTSKWLIILALSYTSNFSSASEADTTLIRQHFNTLLSPTESRNYLNLNALNFVADYIFNVFQEYGDSTVFQNFLVDGKTYKNVLTSFGPKHAPRIIVGAHYDVCGNQDGADDNASGVVGLLELARLLENKSLPYRVDLVAYSLEEPPYFGTNQMGSFQHATYLDENNIPVYGMMSLEMIGYFSDQKKSQAYPLGLLRLFYGNKGDFITVVDHFVGGRFSRETKSLAKSIKTELSVKSFKGPKSLRGIAFSDHLNYWRYDYSAVMITNTGFYRNANYHRHTDVLNTLDLKRMAMVIDLVYNVLTTIE